MIETSQVKILWDFSLDHHLNNHPDIVVFDYSKQLIQFIEVFCPANINIPSKEQEKLHKYCPCPDCVSGVGIYVLYLLIVSLTYVSSQDFLTDFLISFRRQHSLALDFRFFR